MLGFACSLFFRKQMDLSIDSEEFWNCFILTFLNSFGDFDKENMSFFDWILFTMSTIVMLLILMNLFIGILSEKLA